MVQFSVVYMQEVELRAPRRGHCVPVIILVTPALLFLPLTQLKKITEPAATRTSVLTVNILWENSFLTIYLLFGSETRKP